MGENVQPPLISTAGAERPFLMLAAMAAELRERASELRTYAAAAANLLAHDDFLVAHDQLREASAALFDVAQELVMARASQTPATRQVGGFLTAVSVGAGQRWVALREFGGRTLWINAEGDAWIADARNLLGRFVICDPRPFSIRGVEFRLVEIVRDLYHPAGEQTEEDER